MTSIALNQRSLYTNQGNPSIVGLLCESDRAILDIGCGAGDLGARIRFLYPNVEVTGITCSFKEYEQAIHKLNTCIFCDIERESITKITNLKFDALIFSHVLEHLVDPVAVIQKLLPMLKVGGKVIIALPNIANWRERWKLALGRFEYTESGIMDKTHLHFYTYNTAAKYLIDPIEQLKVDKYFVNGSVPLGLFRHVLVPQSLRQAIDQSGCKYMPNLFGGEILLESIKV
jgi:2-polyprenyl-3-methyl-5-hydroxy-6-metoxy-1,4-benzoquinol methylase